MGDVILKPYSQQRADYKERLIRWVVPRLTGDDSDKETTLEMILTALDQAHDDGMADAQSMLATFATARPDIRSLKIAEKAISDVRTRNRENRSPLPPSGKL